MNEEQAESAEARVRESFRRQGFMQTIGAELTRVSSGKIWITMSPTVATTQQHGYVHAGAVTSLLDSACGYAALTLMPPESEVLTVEFKVNFVAPGRPDAISVSGGCFRLPGQSVDSRGHHARYYDANRTRPGDLPVTCGGEVRTCSVNRWPEIAAPGALSKLIYGSAQ